MQEFRADLHCHTTFSDGSLSPIQVIELAKQIGLSGLSITDHDSIEAYESAIPFAQANGLELIIGAEFSASFDKVSIHILAYSFPADHPDIQNFCHQHQLRRQNRNRAILAKLSECGIPITEEEVAACAESETIGRPHIAQAMMKKGYIDTIYEAFRKYLGEGRPCYVYGNEFSVQETIDIIHRAQGLAILAHPHLIKDATLVKKLLMLNFDGLEGYYGKLPLDQNSKWVEIAQRKGWIITGGSDFHGDVKPTVPLGCSWINEETFRRIQQHRK